jgi:polypeptide N-acetylgalactosaminyltransferase
VIDVIDDDTLEFHYGDSKATSVGGFDWNLQVKLITNLCKKNDYQLQSRWDHFQFTWHSIPEKERARHKHPAEPVYSKNLINIML